MATSCRYGYWLSIEFHIVKVLLELVCNNGLVDQFILGGSRPLLNCVLQKPPDSIIYFSGLINACYVVIMILSHCRCDSESDQ